MCDIFNVSITNFMGIKKNTPESDEPDTEEELLARAQIIYDFCRKMGYLEEDGDISDETLRMFMSLADFLDSWFSREDM